MADYDDASYGDDIADVFDELFAVEDTEAAVRFLAAHAGNGPVLELGIGTGRVAVPIAEKGIPVHGVEVSPAMVEKLRAKAGGEHIPVTIGDATDGDWGGPFSLVYLADITFFMLRTQDDQVRCLANAAAHLTKDGLLVLDAYIPPRDQLGWRSFVQVNHAGRDDFIVLNAFEHDSLTQQLRSTYLLVRDGTVRLIPCQTRYVWPAELDLMARLAGLRLRARYGGWDESLPFGASTRYYVSVFERDV